VNSNVAVAQATTQEAVLPQRVQEARGNWLGRRGRVCSRSAWVSGSAC